MCSLKVSSSSKITPRFLTELDGEIVEERSRIVKSCCRVGVAGKTSPPPKKNHILYILISYHIILYNISNYKKGRLQPKVSRKNKNNKSVLSLISATTFIIPEVQFCI